MEDCKIAHSTLRFVCSCDLIFLHTKSIDPKIFGYDLILKEIVLARNIDLDPSEYLHTWNDFSLQNITSCPLPPASAMVVVVWGGGVRL